MFAVKDISKKRFGRLIALAPTNEKKSGCTVWLCQCDCGNMHKASIKNLNNGDTRSCGCLYNQTRNSRTLDGNDADFNNLYSTYKNGAARRNFVFNLSKDEFRKITSQNCHYCGAEPIKQSSRAKIKVYYSHNGIDRKDSSAGYEVDNCIPCCRVCNKMKMDLSYERFLEYISKIYNFRVKLNK